MTTYSKQQVMTRVQRLLKAAEKRSNHVDVAVCTDGYTEPGYKDPESGVVCLANWNNQSHYDQAAGKSVTDDDTMPRLAKRLEQLGCEIEWSDEWAQCDECGKLVRTQADSYHWQRSYWNTESGYTVCADCTAQDPAEYLEHLEGNSSTCATFDVDLEAAGYKLLEGDYANGLYGGQADDPKVIAKSLRKAGVERFVFVLDSVGQFDIRFSVWVHAGLDVECPEYTSPDGKKYWWKAGMTPSFLGNASEPFDIEGIDAVELPNPKFSWCALFQASQKGNCP